MKPALRVSSHCPSRLCDRSWVLYLQKEVARTPPLWISENGLHRLSEADMSKLSLQALSIVFFFSFICIFSSGFSSLPLRYDLCPVGCQVSPFWTGESCVICSGKVSGQCDFFHSDSQWWRECSPGVCQGYLWVWLLGGSCHAAAAPLWPDCRACAQCLAGSSLTWWL